MALGIVALYLGLAIGLSTWIRPRIGYKWWRRLHVLTLGIFVLATIHGLGTGSDTQSAWALASTLPAVSSSACCSAVGFSLSAKAKNMRRRRSQPRHS
jgi:DMSO/TMAO reductase YedYZ heme-binding membrane subunit